MPAKPLVPVMPHVVPEAPQVGDQIMVPEGIPDVPVVVAVTIPVAAVAIEVTYFAPLGTPGCMVARELPVIVPKVPLFSLQ